MYVRVYTDVYNVYIMHGGQQLELIAIYLNCLGGLVVVVISPNILNHPDMYSKERSHSHVGIVLGYDQELSNPHLSN